MIFFLLLFLLLSISSFIYYKAVGPNLSRRAAHNVSSLTEPEALDEMYSLYPHLRRWLVERKSHGQWRSTTLTTPDNVRLHAYVLRAGRPTRRTVILIHGYRSQAVEMLHLAYLYHHQLHFNVVMPDLRAHGHSQGNAIGFGYTDAADVRLWMHHADSLFRTERGDHTQMVIHGLSMGAATAMFVAGQPQPPYVKAYVEDCGYSSVDAELTYMLRRDYFLPRFPFIPLASLLCRWQQGWSFQEASCVESLRRARAPMLFIHGTADRYVPSHMVHELYAAKPHQKEIWEVPEVTHGRAYHDYPADYERRVSRFLDQYLYMEETAGSVSYQ